MWWMTEVEVDEMQVVEKDLQHHLAVKRMALKDSFPQLSPGDVLMMHLVREDVAMA